MAYNNTQILLKECIEHEKSRNENFGTGADFFEFFASSQILKNYELSDDEIEQGIVDAGGDGGCDSIYLFLNNSLVVSEQMETISAPKDSVLELFIIQAKNTTSFKEDALMKWKTVVSNLLDFSKNISEYRTRYNEATLEAFEMFRVVYRKLVTQKIKLKFSFCYATLATELHPNVQQQAEELETVIKGLFPSSNTNVKFVDADSLFNIYNSSAESRVNLKLAEIPISPGQKKNYVALVDLGTYYNFIVDENGVIKKKLFESNVRDYQGHNAVNNCITDTLSNKSDEDFWWLNNGVTILATDAILTTNKELQITNPEIVNGLQTSTEICNFFSEHPSELETEKRTILVRIIVPEDEETRDNIIFATNNQTGISKSSLRVTDPIHLKIELYFKNRGLYYDRRKNYYKNQGKKTAEIVSVSFLGQCLITLFIKKPDYARARPSTLLTNEETYNELYNENQNLEVFFKAAQIGKKVQKNIKLVQEYTQAEKSDILFYVIYGAVATLLHKNTLSPSDILTMNLEELTDDHITKIRNIVYAKYKEMGGNGRVAKSSEFINIIEPLLEI